MSRLRLRWATLLAAGCASLTPGAVLDAAGPQESSRGEILVTLSDADMVVGAYIDGALGPRGPAQRDQLSVVELRGADSPRLLATLPVSNGVGAWPNQLALSPDGRWAAVAEYDGPAAPGATRRAQLPRGVALALIDLRDPAAPRLAQTLRFDDTDPGVGRPAAVEFHPDGRLLALTLEGAPARIALIPFDGERLGVPRLQGLEHAELREATTAGELRWHPSGRYAALTSAASNRVAFYRLEGSAESPQLAPWGATLATGLLPGVGRWTPDGRHFLVTVINIGPALAESAYGRNASTLLSIRFDDDAAPGGERARADAAPGAPPAPGVRHLQVALVQSGLGYVENFVISPDGRWIVGLNMRAAVLPPGAPGHTPEATLELLRFDTASGVATHQSTLPFDGMLPEGIAWNAAARGLAVTIFQQADPLAGGALAFFAFELAADGRTVRLAERGERLGLMRGAHIVERLR